MCRRSRKGVVATLLTVPVHVPVLSARVCARFASASTFFSAKFGFVKYRYRLHAETAKKELHDHPAFGGLCPSIQIGGLGSVHSSRTKNYEKYENNKNEQNTHNYCR